MCEINTSPPATWRIRGATADDDKSARNYWNGQERVLGY